MTVNDFSSIIQLAATLSIVFVAVEYVKSYTSILCEKFFRFQDFVKQSFDECRNILTDFETLSHLSAVDIGNGKTTNEKIEEVKRRNESLNKEIKDEEDRQNQVLPVACEAKSMSSICFYIGLYNIINLFIGSFEPAAPTFIHSFIICFNALCALYVVFGWFVGEHDSKNVFLNYSTLSHPIYGLVTILVISVGVSLLLNNCMVLEPFWWVFLCLSISFSYLNFIVFVFKIRTKANKYKKEVCSQKDALSEKCRVVAKAANDLINATSLINSIKADN